MMDEKIQQRNRELAEQYRPVYEEVCHEIFLHPEEGLKEFFAADYITGRLREAGFRITRPAGGLETAFIAEYGKGIRGLPCWRNMTPCRVTARSRISGVMPAGTTGSRPIPAERP